MSKTPFVHGQTELSNTSLQAIELNPSCLGQAHSNRPRTGHEYENMEPGCTGWGKKSTKLFLSFKFKQMSAEDFARTLSFCQLQIALTVNNFSSEKMISLVFIPAFNLLRRIFARASLFSFWKSVRC